MGANTKQVRLYTKKSLAMGAGRIATVLFLTNLTIAYQTLFLTQKIGIPGDVYGIMSSITTIVSLIFVFIASYIVQASNLPWGKYRSWLYVGGCGASVLLMIMFTSFGMENGPAKYILYGALVIAIPNVFNLGNAGNYSLFPVMLQDGTERAGVSGVINQVGNAFKIVMGFIMAPLVALLCGMTDDVMGYSLYAYLVALAMIACYIIFARAAKPYDPPRKSGKALIDQKRAESAKAPVSEMIKSFFTSAPLLALISKLTRDMGYWIVGSTMAFYYTYVVGSVAMMTVYTSLSAILTFAGSLLPTILSRWFEGRKICMISVAMQIICVLCAYFLGTSAIAFTILLCLNCVGFGSAGAVETAVYADAVDYTTLKHGFHTRGFLMGMFSLPGKISSTLAAAVLGFVLTAISFDKANVTAQAAEGIRNMMSLVPGIFLIVSIVCLILLPVTNAKLQALREQKDAQ